MRVAVLAEQNFNVIDGSSIWLLNACKALSSQPDMAVTMISRWGITSRVLSSELPGDVKIIQPKDIAAATGMRVDTLPTRHLSHVVSSLEAKHGAFDRILVRGEPYLNRLLSNRAFATRVVAYSPGVSPRLGEPAPAWVEKGAKAGTRLVVQSAAAKELMETFYDYPANLIHVAPPFIVDSPRAAPTGDGRTLCYSGKIDPLYGLDWLLDVAEAPTGVADRRISLIAGKDTHRRTFPKFFDRFDRFRDEVRGGLRPTVSITSGVPHAEAKRLMSAADFAFCLRHDSYDDVIEISTKIVEFISMGVPPILNDNALNRGLLGDRYPYLVDISANVVEQVAAILEGDRPELRVQVVETLREVSERFSADRSAAALAGAVRGVDRPEDVLTETPRSIHVATHERKFIDQFEARLAADPNVDLEHTVWPLSRPIWDRLKKRVRADTVFCEWCGENAVWHSRTRQDGRKLIVRLHRFEAFRSYPKRVKWENVDALIVVSDHFRDLMIADHGVDPERIRVFPQYINWRELRRPKRAEARFNIGLVGVNLYDHKRFDRALDFFEALHARDPRFTMSVRSVMPWKIDWIWNNLPDDRRRFEALFERIYDTPALAENICFDPPGRDMEEWYREVGFILSSSDTEGCHTSVIEGMASGCLPVVHDWPGARGLFAPHVYADIKAAIPAVVAFADRPDLDKAREALSQKVERYDLEYFCRMFMKL